MSAGGAFATPRESPTDGPAPDDARGLVDELKRLGPRAIREIARLEREAEAGENPATLGILVTGVALSVWAFVALVIVIVLAASHFIVG